MTHANSNNDEIPDLFAETYGVELFCTARPVINTEKVLTSLKSRFNEVELTVNSEISCGFTFKDFTIGFEETEIHPQIAVIISDQTTEANQLKSSFEQSWRWDNAESAISKCGYSVLVTDFMCSGLEYNERIDLFQKALYSIVENIDCAGIYWEHAQQFIQRPLYLANKPGSEDYNALLGPLNVRFYNIESDDGENVFLMDTIGLAAFDLPDLQCHFMNLDPQDISDLLYEYGDYIYRNGDIIEEGNTIEGITPDDEWICRHEIAVHEPKRVVIDIDPGKGFAAK
jgi:hypothetical protein